MNIVSQRNPRREPSEFTPVQGQRPLVRGLLLAADLVLLTLVSVLVLGRTQPLTLAEWGLCVTALTVGALLAWLAVLEPSGGKLPARDRNDPEPNETPTVSARGHSTLDPRTKS